jgi:hypothetical protein
MTKAPRPQRYLRLAGEGKNGERAGLVTGIIPTVELHANTPTNHQDDGAPVKLNTIVDVTGGIRVEIHHIALFGVAMGTPLTGPKPYSTEAVASFNLRF